jgi:hypothetical protein
MGVDLGFRERKPFVLESGRDWKFDLSLGSGHSSSTKGGVRIRRFTLSDPFSVVMAEYISLSILCLFSRCKLRHQEGKARLRTVAFGNCFS